ncbi:IS1096 element passenger TnpR family protein [Agromyces lapidis]|uniref:DUF4192 family protein n=2 Tax=Agromyces lapidis TaxID=279574 RepID=A0ABV5SLV3_9MICO
MLPSMPPAVPALSIQLDLVDDPVAVRRVVEVDPSTRMTALHRVITEAFGWSADAPHRFTDQLVSDDHDHDDDEDHDDDADTGFFAGTYRGRPPVHHRVWELSHGSSSASAGHVSECAWVDAIDHALGAGSPLYYEYGTSLCRTCNRAPRGSRYDGGREDPLPAPRAVVRIRPSAVPRVRTKALLPHLVDAAGWPPRMDRDFDGDDDGGAGDGYEYEYEYEYEYGCCPDLLSRTASTGWSDALGPRAERPLDPAALRALIEWRRSENRYGFRHDDALIGRALDESSSWPKYEQLAAAQQAIAVSAEIAGPELADPAGAEWAAALTTALRAGLTALPSSRDLARLTGDGASARLEIDAGHEALLRRLRLAYRRSGFTVRARRGDDALADPMGIVRACAEAYWSTASDRSVRLAVAFAIATGQTVDAFVAGESWTAVEHESAARSHLFLETCGGLTPDPDPAAAMRFARLALRN